MKSLKEEYSSRFQNWVLTSSSHGLPNMFRSKNRLIRVMWLVFFLISFSYCTCTIVKSLLEFLKYKTSVSIEKRQEIPATFPAVTFCSLNAFDEEKSDELLTLFNNAIENPKCLGYYQKQKECARNNNEQSVECQKIKTELDVCFVSNGFNIDQNKRFIANYVTEDIYKKEDLGYSFNDLVYACSFNLKECTADDFIRHYSVEYGNCYTFNSEGDKKTIKKGANTALYNTGLHLSIHLKKKTNANLADFSTKRGIYLVVHNQSSLSYTMNDGVNIPAGFDTNVGVSRTFNKKLPQPYSNCINELSELDNIHTKRIIGFFKELNITQYDQNMCFNVCQQDKLIDVCNCTDTITPKFRNALYCMSGDEIYTCMYSFYANNLTQVYKEYCNTACPEKCNTVDYQLNFNGAVFATLSNMRYIQGSVLESLPDDDGELVRFGQQSILTLNINYDNTYYTLVEENALISFESLLGSIGGQLGLFIGISFLSLVEIIEIAVEFANVLIKRFGGRILRINFLGKTTRRRDTAITVVDLKLEQQEQETTKTEIP